MMHKEIGKGATTGPGSRGFSLVELLVVLGIVALAAVFVANLAGTAESAQKVDRAFTELRIVKNAAQSYRTSPAQRGQFTNISITQLATRGYNVEPFTTGTNENAYGLTITVAPAAAGADGTITYATDNAADCNQLIDRWTNITGIKGTPVCATNTLTLTLE